MEIERLIREQIYLMKRRSKHKGIKRNKLFTAKNKPFLANEKQLIGIICVIIGLLLLLVKCSIG